MLVNLFQCQMNSRQVHHHFKLINVITVRQHVDVKIEYAIRLRSLYSSLVYLNFYTTISEYRSNNFVRLFVPPFAVIRAFEKGRGYIVRKSLDSAVSLEYFFYFIFYFTPSSAGERMTPAGKAAHQT